MVGCGPSPALRVSTAGVDIHVTAAPTSISRRQLTSLPWRLRRHPRYGDSSTSKSRRRPRHHHHVTATASTSSWHGRTTCTDMPLRVNPSHTAFRSRARRTAGRPHGPEQRSQCVPESKQRDPSLNTEIRAHWRVGVTPIRPHRTGAPLPTRPTGGTSRRPQRLGYDPARPVILSGLPSPPWQASQAHGNSKVAAATRATRISRSILSFSAFFGRLARLL